MSDFPEDILKAARKTENDVSASWSHERVDIIARAILAERKRCAKVAEYSVDRWRAQGDKCQVSCDVTACEDIAEAIMKGEAG